MEHTKGEWNYHKESDHFNIYITKDGRGKGTAKVYNTFGDEETEANAKLIASAPELLNALKDVFENVNLADTSLGLYKQVENAINKATK